MKLFSLILITFLGMTTSPNAGAVCSSSFFINAVKARRPLGEVYKATEASLIQQGYVAKAEAEIQRQPSNKDGIGAFQIQQAFQHPSCTSCPTVLIDVRGRQRTEPPPPGEKDVFEVDSVSASNL